MVAGGALVLPVPGSAETPFEEVGLSLGGQVRLRAEIDDRDFNGDTNPDGAVSSRVRLQVEAKPSDGLVGFVQIQDVRILGEETNTLADVDADGLDLHQGYLRVEGVGVDGLSIQMGRQEVSFGEQRLIGAVGWTQNARSLDGLLVKHTYEGGHWVSPFAFILDENDAIQGTVRQLSPFADEGRDEDAYLVGIHSRLALADALVAEPHVYGRRVGTTESDLYTLGVYAHGGTGSVIYNATFDYQLGDQAGDDVRAFLAVGHVGVKVDSIQATVGYEYLSGDSDLEDGDVEAFDTLLATNHKFYGEMDYFLALPAHTAQLGLQDVVGKLRWKAADATQVAADVHWFRTAEDDPARFGGEDDLGIEIDVWLIHKWDEHLGLRLGYSAFLPGDAMERRFEALDAAATPEGEEPVIADHGDVAHWFYAQADLKF